MIDYVYVGMQCRCTHEHINTCQTGSSKLLSPICFFNTVNYHLFDLDLNNFIRAFTWAYKWRGLYLIKGAYKWKKKLKQAIPAHADQNRFFIYF